MWCLEGMLWRLTAKMQLAEETFREVTGKLSILAIQKVILVYVETHMTCRLNMTPDYDPWRPFG